MQILMVVTALMDRFVIMQKLLIFDFIEQMNDKIESIISMSYTSKQVGYGNLLTTN